MSRKNVIVAQADEFTVQILGQLTEWFAYQRSIATSADQREAIDEVETRVNTLAAQNHASTAAVRAVLENNAMLTDEIALAFEAREQMADEVDDAYQAGLKAGRKQAESDAQLAALADADPMAWLPQMDGARISVEH